MCLKKYIIDLCVCVGKEGGGGEYPSYPTSSSKASSASIFLVSHFHF